MTGISAPLQVSRSAYRVDGEPMPPLESFHTEEYDSKEAALEAAYQMMYGLTRLPHMKVPYIVEPNGKRIESEEIQDWCKKRSQQSAGS